jgi:heme/copper-type cytochrome/quinol oxidase subunit 3
LQDLTESNGTRSADAAGGDSLPREQRRWAREVLRRGLFELLYLAANLSIGILCLFWLYRLLAHKPAARTALFLGLAAVISLLAYQAARWRVGIIMSRQVERLTAWLIATLGMALVWGGICLAFTVGALRWFDMAGRYSWTIGTVAALCGFIYIVAGEWSELGHCLALPAAAEKTTEADPTIA